MYKLKSSMTLLTASLLSASFAFAQAPAAPMAGAASPAPMGGGNPCVVNLTGNDVMQYNLKEINVPASCKQVTVNFAHVGKLPITAMGHNFVLTATADAKAVDTAGIAAGIKNNHVPPGDKRVIAYTPLVGGGQKNSVTFSTAALKPGGDYTYFCSFPGHFAIMKGKFNFK